MGRRRYDLSSQTYGSVPEWPKGADCKSAGIAYVGSNPARPTTKRPIAFAIGRLCFFNDVAVKGANVLDTDFDSEQQLISPDGQWTNHDYLWSAGPRDWDNQALEHLLHQDHVEPAVELASNLDLDPNFAESTGGMKGSTGLT